MPTMLSESANGLGANSASARSVGKSSACRLERRALSCESSSVLRPALGLGSTLPTTAEPCHAGLPKAHIQPGQGRAQTEMDAMAESDIRIWSVSVRANHLVEEQIW